MSAAGGERGIGLGRLAVLAAVLLAAVLGATDLFNYDLGLARATGEWIVDHGAVPTTNVFSAVNPDYPFVDDKWLFHVLAHGVIDGLGATVAVLVRILLLVLLVGTMVWPSRRDDPDRGGDLSLRGALAVVALIAASERYAWRPELFSLLFVGVFGRVLLARGPGPSRGAMGLLVLLQALWASLHGYFVLGPILAAAAAVGAAIDVRRGLCKRGAALRRLYLVPLLGLAPLLNPYGLDLALSPVEILLDLRQNFELYSSSIVEFIPPFGPFAVLPSDLVAYRLLLGIAAVGLLLMNRRVTMRELLPVAALFVMSLQLRRNAAPFAVLAAPVVAGWLWDGLARLPRGRRRVEVVAAFVALIAALGLGFAQISGHLPVHDRLPKRFGFGVSQLAHPDAEVDFLLAEVSARDDGGGLFNSFSFGSYFVGRAFPERRPFIDGNTAGYPVAFLGEYARAVRGELEVDAWIDEHRLTHLLVKPGHALTPKLLRNPRLAPVFLGRHACVFVVTERFDREWVASRDLRPALAAGTVVPSVPETPRSNWRSAEYPETELNLARFYLAAESFPAAAAAAERAIDVHDGLYECWQTLGLARMGSGDPPGAVEALERAVRLAPAAAECHADLGLARMRAGDLAAAESDLARASRLDPDSGLIAFRQAYLLLRMTRLTDAEREAQRALDLDPSLYRSHLVLAQIALARRDQDAARAHLETSLQIAPDQPERTQTEETLRRLGG